MKFVTISEKYYALLKEDPQMLFKENRRPHLLILSLTYKGRVCRFAIPLRSNISSHEPKNHYFALPNRPTTRSGNHHGLHYIKMFPISKACQEKFWTGGNPSYLLYQNIIAKNEKKIVAEAQAYLDRYAEGNHPRFSVDIDGAFSRLDSYITNLKDAETHKEPVTL